MFGIGGVELAIILVFAFLVFGPDKLPQIIRSVTQILNQLKGLRDQANQVIKAEVVDPLKDIEQQVAPFKKDASSVSDKLVEKLGLATDGLGDTLKPLGEALKDTAEATTVAATAATTATTAATTKTTTSATNGSQEVKQTANGTKFKLWQEDEQSQGDGSPQKYEQLQKDGSSQKDEQPQAPKTDPVPPMPPVSKGETFAERKARLEQEHVAAQQTSTQGSTPDQNQSPSTAPIPTSASASTPAPSQSPAPETSPLTSKNNGEVE